jgi:hypothetical protein
MNRPLTHGVMSAARHVAVTVRLAERKLMQQISHRVDTTDDRGEGPVSTAIMVALIAAVAVTVGGVILLVANGWTARIPRATP